jgi:hypothetical protein
MVGKSASPAGLQAPRQRKGEHFTQKLVATLQELQRL